MQTVRCADGTFYLDEQPTFLYGGELHYFRLPREAWAARLAQAKGLGLTMIGSYIPWIWHEPTPGAFDFTGATHPQRDLAAFLDLVADAGLLFLARIGPVSNAELVGEGIPPWLFAHQPDLQLKRADGSYMAGMASYRHPGFLARVEAWYDALRPVLVPHLPGGRGTIPLVQLCNEIDMPTWLNRQGDYHDHVQAEFGSAQPDGHVHALPDARATDWMAFYASHFAGYVDDLARLAELPGVPWLANLAMWTDHEDRGRGINAPMTTMMFRNMAGSDIILGGDYYPRRVDFDNFHDLEVATEVVRMVSAPGAPVTSPELMAGCNVDRPKLYAADVDLTLQLSAGQGLNMINLYMLAGGENPDGIGLFGREHDWQAPIAMDGTERPSAQAIRAFGAFLAANPGYGASRKHVDTQVAFYAPYFQTNYLRGPAVDALERRRVEIFQDGLLRLLALNHVAYEFVDIARRKPTGETLWLYAEPWMDRGTQRRLADFVDHGGKLMCFPTVPTMDLDGAPCATLADALGGPREVRTGFVHLDGTTLPVHGTVRVWDEADDDEVLGRTDDGQACVVWRPASGLLVGYGLKHVFDRQVAIARGWATRLGIQRALVVEPGDVPGVARVAGDAAYVCLANVHDEARTVTGTFQGRPFGPIAMDRRTAKTFRV